MLQQCSSLFKVTLLFLLLARAVQTLINYWSLCPEVTESLLQEADKNGILLATVYLLSKQTNKLNYLVFYSVWYTNILCSLQKVYLFQNKVTENIFVRLPRWGVYMKQPEDMERQAPIIQSHFYMLFSEHTEPVNIHMGMTLEIKLKQQAIFCSL